MADARGTLIFDGDCGFCTSSAHLLGRIAPRIEVVPWQGTDIAALGFTPEQCSTAVRWIGADRSRAGAETAIARALGTASWPWRVVGVTILLLRPLSSVVYRLVAANRSRLPGGTPACAVPKRPAA